MHPPIPSQTGELIPVAAVSHGAPTLSYRRQQPSDALAWILRWLGAWIALQGLHGCIRPPIRLVSRWGGGAYWSPYTYVSLIGGAAFIAVGIGIYYRRRWALRSVIALLWIGLPLWLVSGLSGFRVGQGYSSVVSQALMPFLEMLLLAVLLERAENSGILLPSRGGSAVMSHGNEHFAAFARLLGIYYLSYFVYAIAQVFALVTQPSPGPFQAGYYFAAYGCVRGTLLGACGLALYRGIGQALVGIAALVFIGTLAGPLISFQFSFSPAVFWQVAISLPFTVGNCLLLLALYRRIAASRADVGGNGAPGWGPEVTETDVRDAAGSEPASRAPAAHHPRALDYSSNAGIRRRWPLWVRLLLLVPLSLLCLALAAVAAFIYMFRF